MSKEQTHNLDFPKIQFEVRFTHIIASNIIREVLNPFLRIATSFNIQNQGLLEEQIRLNFEDDSFAIICSWDRVVLISENDINRFSDDNSSISVLFDILKKLSSTAAFGMFKNYLFNAFVIKKLENKSGNNLMNFKSKFLNTASIDAILKDPTDYSITLDKLDGSKLTTITIGPYSENDIEKYNFYPLNKSRVVNLLGQEGDLISIKIYNSVNLVDFSVFKKLIQETNKYANTL